MSSRNRIPFHFHGFPRSRGARSRLPWKKAAGGLGPGLCSRRRRRFVCVRVSARAGIGACSRHHALRTRLWACCRRKSCGSSGARWLPLHPAGGRAGARPAPSPAAGLPGLPPCAFPRGQLPPAGLVRWPGPPPPASPASQPSSPLHSWALHHLSVLLPCLPPCFLCLCCLPLIWCSDFIPPPLLIPTGAYQHSLLFRSQ